MKQSVPVRVGKHSYEQPPKKGTITHIYMQADDLLQLAILGDEARKAKFTNKQGEIEVYLHRDNNTETLSVGRIGVKRSGRKKRLEDKTPDIFDQVEMKPFRPRKKSKKIKF